MPTNEHITVKAAHGKELLSKKAVLSHLLENKPFLVLSFPHGVGTYISLFDTQHARRPITLEVRYGKKGQKVTLLDTSDIPALQKELERKKVLLEKLKGGKKNG